MAKDLLWDLVGTNSDLAGGLELFVIEKYIDNLPDLTAGEKSDLDNVAYLVIDRHASKETTTKALYTIHGKKHTDVAGDLNSWAPSWRIVILP